MVQKRDFDEKMSKLSDEELYDVLAHEKDYAPEALDSAKSELKSRNLSPERKTELETITGESKKIYLSEQRKRHGCLTSWLILMLIGNTVGALMYLANTGGGCWIEVFYVIGRTRSWKSVCKSCPAV